MPSEEELWAAAKRRVEERIGFYIHLGVYICVNVGLITIWYFANQGFPWFIFITAFWGIGIAAHGIGVFFAQDYADKKTEQEFEKLKKRRF